MTDREVATVLEAPGDDELRNAGPRAIGALLVASGLLRVGAVGVGVAVQFRISDLAHGRPSGVAIGLVGASQAVTEMVFAPILARYADRFGRRIFLVAGPIVCMVAVLLLYLGVRPAQLGGARLLEGVGAAAFVPVALGTVAAATSGDRRRRAGASGAFEASTLIGYAGGFGLGSVAYFGLQRGSFILLAGLYACAAAVCLIFVPRIPPLPVHPLRAVFQAAFGPGPMRTFLPAWIMSFALIGAFVANLPALLRHHAMPSQALMHHFDVRVIGLFLIGWIAIFLIGIILWTPFVARLGPAIVMRRAVPGAWLTMAALVAINHLPFIGMVLIVPFLVLGILWLAGFGPAAVTYLADCSESLSADRSALMSFYTVALAGGGALGAVIGGVAAHLLFVDGLVILGLLLSTATFFTLGPVVRFERNAKSVARA
ncbi:MAG TPA: MFS transporter [Candidatus Saccharimonadales bacterium]|nr:MFS transporter [Candidatus Saccharimonadales bacterium]